LTREEFAGWKSKLSEGHLLRAHYAPDSEDHQIKAACQLALNAWTTLNCRDAGRVDIRFDSDDADGVPNVLEVSIIRQLYISTPSFLAVG
jgi:D-alanine-D-alanine ligase-like ATP-grasp enzyme